jgi:hypothetical protein
MKFTTAREKDDEQAAERERQQQEKEDAHRLAAAEKRAAENTELDAQIRQELDRCDVLRKEFIELQQKEGELVATGQATAAEIEQAKLQLSEALERPAHEYAELLATITEIEAELRAGQLAPVPGAEKAARLLGLQSYKDHHWKAREAALRTENGELRKFIADGERKLPEIADTLEQTGKAIRKTQGKLEDQGKVVAELQAERF